MAFGLATMGASDVVFAEDKLTLLKEFHRRVMDKIGDKIGGEEIIALSGEAGIDEEPMEEILEDTLEEIPEEASEDDLNETSEEGAA